MLGKMSFIPLFLLVIVVFVGFTASGQESLKLGSDEWAPFHYMVKSKKDVQGFTPTIVKAVLKNMNVKISDHQIYPWTRALKMVFDGRLDALFTTTKTKEREKYCHFPKEPLVSFSYVFFIRKEDVGKLKFDTFDDLKGHKIGTVRGFSYTKEFLEFIKREKNSNEVTVGEQNFKKLMTKRIDFVAAPLAVGNWNIKNLGFEGKCVALKKTFSTNNLYIMFSKKKVSRKFVNKFSKELKKYKSSDGFKKLYK